MRSYTVFLFRFRQVLSDGVGWRINQSEHRKAPDSSAQIKRKNWPFWIWATFLETSLMIWNDKQRVNWLFIQDIHEAKLSVSQSQSSNTHLAPPLLCFGQLIALRCQKRPPLLGTDKSFRQLVRWTENTQWGNKRTSWGEGKWSLPWPSPPPAVPVGIGPGPSWDTHTTQ